MLCYYIIVLAYTFLQNKKKTYELKAALVVTIQMFVSLITIIVITIIYLKIPFSKNSYHIRNWSMICKGNQSAGFYMIRVFAESCSWIEYSWHMECGSCIYYIMTISAWRQTVCLHLAHEDFFLSFSLFLFCLQFPCPAISSRYITPFLPCSDKSGNTWEKITSLLRTSAIFLNNLVPRLTGLLNHCSIRGVTKCPQGPK